MRIFLDTNIVIDYLADRQPFGKDAYRIFQMHNDMDICVSSLSFTTIYYVLKKGLTRDELLSLIIDLQSIVSILPVDARVIANAAKSEFKDFEDAVQYFTALSASSDYIITRNIKDYTHSAIKAVTPQTFLDIVSHR